ncbi:MAG: trpD [Rickettsiaceae bacterium]|jgi:anthranilate phosphoribosyltransferase|nr:trpD [Rickettsiaceae bacterium]
MTEIYSFIEKIARCESLSEAEASRLIQIVLLGGASPPQIAAILLGLRVKGESVEEIYGAYRALSVKFQQHILGYDVFDVCGTGSVNYSNLNVSTAVAFVAAGAGVKVAKHIDKTSVTPAGSTEVLKKLGVNIEVSLQTSLKALEEANICLTSFPRYHNAMREILPVIKDLGIKNIFNLIGPLVNPIHCNNRLIGVYHPNVAKKIAEVLIKIGAKSCWVVCGEDYTDEISITGETSIVEIQDGVIKEFTLHPSHAGFEVLKERSELEGYDPIYNASRLYDLLRGEQSAFREIVLLNAAAAFVINEKCRDLKDGVELAKRSIDSRDAYKALQKLVEITNQEMDN